jgi:hypothetical protein
MDRSIDGIPHLPLQDAAAILQTTPLRILMLLKKGSLTGVEDEGEWYLNRESLLTCMQNGSLEQKIGGCHLSCAAHACCSGEV